MAYQSLNSRDHAHAHTLAHPPPSYPHHELPPSYDDATRSETSPLLVGPPPDYGMYAAYPEPDDDSSTGSSEIEATGGLLPEWLGQVVVVSMFIAICYGFWKLAVDPPDSLGGWPLRKGAA